MTLKEYIIPTKNTPPSFNVKVFNNVISKIPSFH